MRAASLPKILVERETALQRAVTVYIVTGLIFMLLPGTFLGVWNLLSISSRHTVASLSPAWLQAHGHAQLFGWIGTFVLGIGFYSLSKMGGLAPVVPARAWQSYALWTPGVLLRWCANVTAWHWRIAVPLSAALELAGFVIFLRAVSRHRRPAGRGTGKPVWMLIVISSTFGFLITLLANLGVGMVLAIRGESPAVPLLLDQRLLALPTWGFLVPAVWGFNARWLPVFAGLKPASRRTLFLALGIIWASIVEALFGFTVLSTALLPMAAAVSIAALHVFEPSEHAPRTNGVHPSFPWFPRIAYAWLAVASVLSVWAALADSHGGIWGASRHALTVGFLAVMVFAIGQRILPAFCGARVLFSKTLMLASLLLLNLGCLLRVASEIPAYEGFWPPAWSVLPVSAVSELAAVTLFGANLLLTFARPPAHLAAG